MIRRPARGATVRPLQSRPGNGYGRPLRAGPSQRWRRLVEGAIESPDPQVLLDEARERAVDPALPA